jgi:hypothetical protein
MNSYAAFAHESTQDPWKEIGFVWQGVCAGVIRLRPRGKIRERKPLVCWLPDYERAEAECVRIHHRRLPTGRSGKSRGSVFCSAADRHDDRQRLEQLGRFVLIILPRRDGALIDERTDLSHAGRADVSRVAVEFQTARVSGAFAGPDRSAHDPFDAADRLLVIEVDDGG